MIESSIQQARMPMKESIIEHIPLTGAENTSSETTVSFPRESSNFFRKQAHDNHYFSMRSDTNSDYLCRLSTALFMESVETPELSYKALSNEAEGTNVVSGGLSSGPFCCSTGELEAYSTPFQTPLQTPHRRQHSRVLTNGGVADFTERRSVGHVHARGTPLLYTPQPCASSVLMQQQLDTELARGMIYDSFESMPAVTQLWNQQLFIGGFPDNETVSELMALGITHIINCCCDDWPTPQDVREKFYVTDMHTFDKSDYHILYHCYERFSNVVNSIVSDPNGKVFVHCVAGVNRSVALCAAYLIDILRITPVEVIRIFRENGRERILQNEGFRRQLVDFFFELQCEDNEEMKFSCSGALFRTPGRLSARPEL